MRRLCVGWREEFTCLCPATGQPDFALLRLLYFPNKRCVELKSLKQYIASFRDVGGYHEDVSNKILDDLISVLDPKLLQINAKFNVRGGTYPTIRCVHKNPDWANVELPKYFNEKNYCFLLEQKFLLSKLLFFVASFYIVSFHWINSS